MWKERRPKIILDIEAGQTGLSTRKLVLETFGYNVLAAATGKESLSLLAKHPIDAVLLDASTNDIPLAKLTAQIKSSRQQVPILLLADSPFIPSELRSTVDGAIQKLRDPKDTVSTLDELLGVTGVPKPSGKALEKPKKKK